VGFGFAGKLLSRIDWLLLLLAFGNVDCDSCDCWVTPALPSIVFLLLACWLAGWLAG